jgi:hypothetical protein
MAKKSLKLEKSSNSIMSQENISALVGKKAQEIYEKSGRKPGNDLQNWLEAEKIIMAKISK